jgi:hypothetical protein
MDEAMSKPEVGIVAQEAKGAATRRPSEKTFRTTPKNVASERDFNRVDVEGMDPNAVEKALAEFEGLVAPALERIKAAKSLSEKKDRDALMNLICALAIRNPRQRKTINEFVAEVAQRMLEVGLETEKRWQSEVAQMKAAGRWDENSKVSYEDIKSMITERRHTIEVAKEFNIAMEIEQHKPLLEHLGKRKWQMLVANKGSGGFVTTDVPVCLRWSDGQDHGMFSPGFGVNGTEVIFPISTNLALIGSFEGDESVADADIFTAGNINTIVIGNAHKQVYAHDYSFNYMRPLSSFHTTLWALGSPATRKVSVISRGEDELASKTLPRRLTS